MEQWQNTAIDNIMYISRNGNGNACSHSRKRRQIFFLSAHTPVEPVLGHLAYQRKWIHKRKSSHKRTHQIIGYFHSAACKLRKKDCKILTTVIIINGSLRVPEIPCRQCFAPHHGFHKSVIHKFLCSICLRTKSCQICPEKKNTEKQKLLSENQVHFPRWNTFNSMFLLYMKQNNTDYPTKYGHSRTGCKSKWKNFHRHKKPGKKSCYGNCQNFRKKPSFIFKSLKKSSRQRHCNHSHKKGQKPPGPESPYISAKKIGRKSDQNHRRN